jgi:diguanylate cyclase (GGDEF)-like protein
MARLTAFERDEPDRGELRRVLRSVTEVDGLLILLSILYLFVDRARVAWPGVYMGAIVLYGLLVLALRYAPMLADMPREKLLVGTGAMVLFITAILAASGGDRGPLLNLYLLPIITAALTLGRSVTVAVVLAALLCRLGLGYLVAGGEMLTLGYALRLVAEGVPVLLVALLTSMLAADIQDVHDRLQAHTEQDSVTGLLNLEAFTRLLSQEARHAETRGSGFALLVIDVDGLQGVNERYGHEAGNRALVAVAQALKRSARTVDLVGRYGGDEFVMYLSGAGPSVAKVVANRIRHNVATTTLEVGGAMHRVSVGIGAAVFPTEGRELRELVNAAQRSLGRDRDSRRPLETRGPATAGAG